MIEFKRLDFSLEKYSGKLENSQYCAIAKGHDSFVFCSIF